MSTKKTADLLFGFQIIMAWIFSIAQASRMIESTEGMTITWFLFFEAFLALNLYLAKNAYREVGDRKSLQILLVYVNWTVLITVNLAIVLWKGVWSQADSSISCLVLVGGVLTLMFRYRGSLIQAAKDPVTRGILALFFKAVPQLFIGYCILQAHGANGLAGLTVLIGHITVTTRIVELLLAIRASGWNRNQVGMLIGELGNEGSWIVTSIIWLNF